MIPATQTRWSSLGMSSRLCTACLILLRSLRSIFRNRVATLEFVALILLIIGVTFVSLRAVRISRRGLAVLSWIASSPAIESPETPVIRTVRSGGDLYTGMARFVLVFPSKLFPYRWIITSEGRISFDGNMVHVIGRSLGAILRFCCKNGWECNFRARHLF